MKSFIFTLIFYFVGTIICSYGVIAPLIVIRTAIPITKHLRNENLIYSKDAKKAHMQSAFTICFWIIIDIIAVVLLILYANTFMKVGFAIGFVFSFLTGIGQTGFNMNNMSDYLSSYRRFLPSENAEKIVAELEYISAILQTNRFLR